MVNWLMYYDHWCVILGWFTEGEHLGEHMVLFYNHYYDDVRFAHAPGLGGDVEVRKSEWTNTGLHKD